MVDDRFKALFEKEEFQINENSEEYKLHHPSGVKQIKEIQSDLEDFEIVDSSDEEEKKLYTLKTTENKPVQIISKETKQKQKRKRDESTNKTISERIKDD